MTMNEMIALNHVRTSTAGEHVVMEKDHDHYSRIVSDGRTYWYDLENVDMDENDWIEFVTDVFDLSDDWDAWFWTDNETGAFVANL